MKLNRKLIENINFLLNNFENRSQDSIKQKYR